MNKQWQEYIFDYVNSDQWVCFGWGWDYVSETKVTGTVFDGQSIPEGHC